MVRPLCVRRSKVATARRQALRGLPFRRAEAIPIPTWVLVPIAAASFVLVRGRTAALPCLIRFIVPSFAPYRDCDAAMHCLNLWTVFVSPSFARYMDFSSTKNPICSFGRKLLRVRPMGGVVAKSVRDLGVGSGARGARGARSG